MNIHNHELNDDLEWATQSENWLAEFAKLQRTRKLRQRNPNPLILSGHGTSMRVERGTLLIKEGFYFYPQEQFVRRYFPGDLDLPRKILLLDGNGSLSFDVLDWLSEQDVSLIRVKWNGDVSIVCSANGFAADQDKVNWQRELREDPAKQISYSCDLISRKLKNSLILLQNNIPQSELKDKALARAKSGIAELKSEILDIQQVRAIEGECASAYFRAWTKLGLNWKTSRKHPIPDHWKYYRARSSVHEYKPENRRATDPVNALLNYGYAVKQSKLQIEAIGEGYDPTMGIMHHGSRGKPAYIFDLLEPERPKVDAAILEFVQTQQLSPVDFIMSNDGTCRLSPGLAKLIAAIV